MVGVHRLSDYGHANTFRTGPDDKKRVRVKVPRGKYSAIRCLVAGSFGNADMPVVLEFAGGPKQSRLILCDNWSHGVAPLRPNVVPALTQLDWIRNNDFQDRNLLCVHEFVLTVDPALDLVAFVLEVDKATYAESRTRFQLYAATGVLAED